MSALNTLKLVVSKPQRGMSPVVVRRNKLSIKLNEQIQLATAKREGRTYAPTKLKAYKDKESGERKTMEVVKRVREWWYTTEAGKVNLVLKYGSKQMEIAKGKNAIEVASADELVSALQTLKAAVEQGELDTQIEAASAAVRKAFKR